MYSIFLEPVADSQTGGKLQHYRLVNELDNPERGSDSRTLKNIIKTPGGGGRQKKLKERNIIDLQQRKKRNS